MGRPELAELFGVSVETASKVLAGAKELDDKQLTSLAGRTGVPLEFFAHGFETPPESPVLAEKIEALESQMQTVLGILTTRVAGEAATTARKPPGERVGRADERGKDPS